MAKTLAVIKRSSRAVLTVALMIVPAAHAYAHQDTTTIPTVAEEIWRIITLRDYNTRIVLLGSTALGVCLGIVGVFMLLRKRSLMGDVVSHAALPGICVAFLIMEMIKPGMGKWLPGLLTGALVAGLAGMTLTIGIRRYTRVKEDAALAIVLSTFFGAGIALLSVIQTIPTGNVAGLNHFIFGKAASMIASDVWMIGIASTAAIALVAALFKEFALLCFDERFARTQGWPAGLLDLLLMGLVVFVSVIGLQSVGLLLVVALLIIPAAAARFWSDRIASVTLIAAGLGGASAFGGVVFSAVFPRIAAGAVIVLTGSALFIISLVFGFRRGVVRRLAAQWRLKRRVGRQHLLRAIYEHLETRARRDETDLVLNDEVSLAELAERRSWSAGRLQGLARQAVRDGLLEQRDAARCRLTAAGMEAAERNVRNHRLWELYLINYADIAPSHVDRDADEIEHILGAELVDELEELLSRKDAESPIPESPHAIEH